MHYAIDGSSGALPLLEELRALEARAGIAEAAQALRWNLATAPGDPDLNGKLRELYFAVADPWLRRRLIAKHRDISRFARAWSESDLADARRRCDALEHRSQEGWWLAAVVGAALIIIGYELFAFAGALAAAVVALFVGNGIEQSARQRQRRALAEARSEVEAAAVRTSDNGPLFSEAEERSGGAAASAEQAL